VWLAVGKIPFGQTTTYAKLAEQLGNPHRICRRLGQEKSPLGVRGPSFSGELVLENVHRVLPVVLTCLPTRRLPRFLQPCC
jgi:hypothetical protein